jgi:hypothetical protein
LFNIPWHLFGIPPSSGKKISMSHGFFMLHLPLHVVYFSFLLPFEPIPIGFQTQT